MNANSSASGKPVPFSPVSKRHLWHGTRQRLHLQRLHRTIGRRQHQHAFQRPAFLGERFGRRHAQHETRLRKAHCLRGGRIHDVTCQRKEPRAFRMRNCKRFGRNEEIERRPKRIAHRPRRRHGHTCTRSRKCAGARRFDRGRSDLQRHAQRRLFRDADFLADEPARRGLQRHRVAGRGIRRGRHVREDPHLAFIAIVHEGTDRQAHRIGPL